MHLKKKSVSIYRLCVGLPFTADIRHSMYDLTTCLHVVIKCEPLHVCVCVLVCSRCPVAQTGWSLLLLPRADGPSHVLL